MFSKDIEKESQRLSALHNYGLLDSPAEEAFDCITRLARAALDVPISLITLIDRDRQWFKSRQGVRLQETPRDISFCDRTIENNNQPLNIPDLRKDSYFGSNPMVKGFPFLRFYCGMPLRTKDGFNLGSLCVLGYRPRKLKDQELAILADLARLTLDEIELRHITDVDYLTGLASHRTFMNTGAETMKQCGGQNMSVLIFDVDRIKEITQKYGPSAGDMLTQKIAERCRPLFTDKNAFARASGRFAVLLPNTNVGVAQKMANEIAAVVDTIDGPGEGAEGKLSCRFGVAELTPHDKDFRFFYNRAEISLQKSQPHTAFTTTATGDDMQASYSYGQ
ncbi:MAG: sensor domain-containing diguanylate cyclase [Alphaproteobacteria bacterium]